MSSESYESNMGRVSLPDAAITFTSYTIEDTYMNMQPILLNLIAKHPPRKPHIQRRVTTTVDGVQLMAPVQSAPVSD